MILLLLSQNHLMLGFLYLGWMTAWISRSRFNQFHLHLIHHFNCRSSSNLVGDFDNLRKFSLLFDMILIYDRLLRFINNGSMCYVLLGLLWVVITFDVSMTSLCEIRRSPVLADATVAKHVWSSTFDESVWSRSIEDSTLLCNFIQFVGVRNRRINFLLFGWHLNWMSRTLFAHRPCRCWFLLFQKWNINSFIWLQNVQMAWPLSIPITHVSFVIIWWYNYVSLDLVFLLSQHYVLDICKLLAFLHEFLSLDDGEEVPRFFNKFRLCFGLQTEVLNFLFSVPDDISKSFLSTLLSVYKLVNMR